MWLVLVDLLKARSCLSVTIDAEVLKPRLFDREKALEHQLKVSAIVPLRELWQNMNVPSLWQLRDDVDQLLAMAKNPNRNSEATTLGQQIQDHLKNYTMWEGFNFYNEDWP